MGPDSLLSHLNSYLVSVNGKPYDREHMSNADLSMELNHARSIELANDIPDALFTALQKHFSGTPIAVNRATKTATHCLQVGVVIDDPTYKECAKNLEYQDINPEDLIDPNAPTKIAHIKSESLKSGRSS